MSHAIGKSLSLALEGITGHVVTTEALVGNGVPKFKIVGLPDASLRESAERLRAALMALGVGISSENVTINLSPGWVPKTGTGFDVAMAMALLAASKVVVPQVSEIVFLGELALDGSVLPVRGVLPAVAAAVAAGHQRIVVASENEAEASLVQGAEVLAVSHLSHIATRFACLDQQIPYAEPRELLDAPRKVTSHDDLCMSDVRGQHQARFGTEVAAAGGHNLLLMGAPGAGKTMLAKRLPTILPPMAHGVALEATSVHSLTSPSGAVTSLIATAPFEAPHHTATPAALIGGGSSVVTPGCVSRAHGGVLFLDEAPEFSRSVLQALRQPLESGVVDIARAKKHVQFPARFQLVLAANPCPCGKAMDPSSVCECPSQARRSYLSKISGPLLDRIDVQVTVAKVTKAHMTSTEPAETSAAIRERVVAARQAQATRWAPHGIHTNSAVPGTLLRGQFALPGDARASLDLALDRGVLTGRGYDRVLRLAWTISDLQGAGSPTADHVGLALSLRTLSDTR